MLADAMQIFEQQSCPHCGEMLDLAVDPTGGSSQQWVTDCEVCCSPILVRIEIDLNGGVRITAEAE